MSIFKCKMCGGTIEFEPGATVGVCEYCGVKQTLPRLGDERRANLYDRANHLRRNNEFDKAAAIYEQILTEDTTDAEAYWSLVLCQYGIEYVEDPASHKRVPTVNRAQFTSVYDDDNYRSALRYADAFQRELYENEAKAINDIQKGILAISQREEPFDVFICYKETDNNGRRTPDSVLATDLYHQLTQEGFKVFFSRITLEDKLGTAYEPYIFAALNSAKVMVALGTKQEYFNAAWVKNEWSRYLALVKQSGGKKTLIPAYRDMDPYDLPEEFSHLQAQDMSRLGFMQDLIRGIKKLTAENGPKPAVIKETVVRSNESGNLSAILDRGFLALEDGEWEKADGFFEQALNFDAKNAAAYLGKLMAELRVKKQADLKNCPQPFNGSNNCQKALRFGDEALKTELEEAIRSINDRNENARLTRIYNDAVNAMNAANTELAYKAAAETFKAIPGFKDADALAGRCFNKAETCRVKEQAERAERERKEEERRIAAEKAAKKRKKIAAIVTSIVVACIAFLIVLTTVIIPTVKYNAAVDLYNAGKYDEAIAAFKALDGYKDSADRITACEKAKKDAAYNEAVSLKEAGKYNEAIALFESLNGYKDSSDMIESIRNVPLEQAYVGAFVKFGAYEQDNNTSNGKEEIEWLVLAKEGDRALLISKYALDCQQYYTSYTEVTWETCSLREWLNGTFLSAAFSSEEQNRIISSTVTADRNPSYSTSPGNNTTDKIFLLSITEVNKYFSSDSARQCQGTAYCYAKGAEKVGNGNCWWWLRPPGGDSGHAAGVDDGGSVYDDGFDVLSVFVAVRPAMWIDLGS